jgi:hypothetical protein
VTAPDWRRAPDDVTPIVLILGGFLTSPPMYRPMRNRLLRRGAADVVVANVWTPHWLIGAGTGLRRIVDRGAVALERAVELAAASDQAQGAPILLVGHSAGGLVGRILTAMRPFQGRHYDASADIGALVTLGTPHAVAATPQIGHHIERLAGRFANAVVPGATFAPTTGYLAVAATSIPGRRDGNGRERVAARLYRGLLGPTSGSRDGDGVVPADAALLAGARTLVLPDVVHGQGYGRPWYGADPGLDQWWPIALEVWHEALRRRALEAASADPADPVDRPLRRLEPR